MDTEKYEKLGESLGVLATVFLGFKKFYGLFFTKSGSGGVAAAATVSQPNSASPTLSLSPSTIFVQLTVKEISDRICKLEDEMRAQAGMIFSVRQDLHNVKITAKQQREAQQSMHAENKESRERENKENREYQQSLYNGYVTRMDQMLTALDSHQRAVQSEFQQLRDQIFQMLKPR